MRYEAIAALSAQLLAAARKADWEMLIRTQDHYKGLVDSLKELDPTVRLDDAERRRRFDLLRQILADDAAIRDLANPRLAQLSALFAANRQTPCMAGHVRAAPIA